MSLTIVKDLGMRREKGCTRRWCIAKCSYCGKESEHRTQSLKTKKSCGCATFLKAKVKHGMAGTRQYQIWSDMKDRCSNPNNKSYVRYGGRGITYDKKWEIFEGFWEDMANGYTDEMTIERLDNNKGYTKENCIWIPIQEQAKNRHAINTFKKRKPSSYARKITLEDIRPFGEKYKTAKKFEKGKIMLEVVKTLGITKNTAKIYLAKYVKGTLYAS